jgi:hypothetical protein
MSQFHPALPSDWTVRFEDRYRELSVDCIELTPVHFSLFPEDGEPHYRVVEPDLSDLSFKDLRSILDGNVDIPDDPIDDNQSCEDLGSWIEANVQSAYYESDELTAAVQTGNREYLVGLICDAIDNEYADCDLDELRDQVLQYLDEGSDPVFNYVYPLPADFEEQDAGPLQTKLLQSLPLVVVEINDYYFLALTGGGQDLTWDIAAAYIAAGYLPPFHFTDLPHFAGQQLTEENEFILGCCLQSCWLLQNWVEVRQERLVDYYQKLQQEKAGVTQ